MKRLMTFASKIQTFAGSLSQQRGGEENFVSKRQGKRLASFYVFQEEIHLHAPVSLLQVDQVAERRQSLAAVESLNVRRGTLKRGSIAKVTLVFY